MGDDQVMNRMLAAWIDDSVEQDKRVLEHMKEVEATGPLPTEEDVLVCRAIWETVKEEVLPVRIPFARRIQFSTTQNRRNPGMLFDLIKCRARLFYLQRDRGADGAVIARPEDFVAAARLYSALSGTTGSQETKLTKNEAAALETVARMGVEVFTVRQLQSALGLSYYQTRRLLNGYVSRGTPYSGLLEKCPAISLYDATVTQSDDGGVTVRRREQYFTFDHEVYRVWSGGTSVWLDDDPDDGSNGSRLQRNCSNCCQQEAGRKEEDSRNGVQNREIDRPLHPYMQQNERMKSTGEEASNDSGGTCVSRTAANEPVTSVHQGGSVDPGQNMAALTGSTCCQHAANVLPMPSPVNPADYIALPVPKDEPCHVCGRRPTSSVKRGGGQYLCYDCLKKARRPAKVQPLPDILDHRTFTRTKVELGRCDVCGAGKAVYHSQEAQAKVCDQCYARLVRVWNQREGVR
ncbi:hypothetical protein DSECCO2_435360 [anaerobic digester metagenome]